ncbi:hypothetical protein PH210_06135 [Paenibacillus sp. BSR1-1]|uniref:hypothetical protein n=1 Tax=Paenibacillus sp. BSR1-1 TaxID=3020845 RepID=UPI0025B041EB|nr:hypothetical protein [Paenibacillus sp. BSR1-1]MDN3015784.1 hypothetical protein [Paenibacillus sp. BSR1-1]
MKPLAFKVNETLLKDWVSEWKEEEFVVLCKSLKTEDNAEYDPTLLYGIINKVKSCISSWRKDILPSNDTELINFILDLLKNNRAIVHTYFRTPPKKRELRIANYYEILLTPLDIYTIKRITSFEGEVHGDLDLSLKDVCEAEINVMSDVFWFTYFDLDKPAEKWINPLAGIEQKPRFMSLDAASPDEYTKPKQYLTCKILFDEQYYKDNIVNIELKKEEVIQHFLYFAALKGFNFGVTNFHHLERRKGGIDNPYSSFIIENPFKLELTPLKYFNAARSTTDSRLQFLSYYNVLEYFFNQDTEFKSLKKVLSDTFSFSDHSEIVSWFYNTNLPRRERGLSRDKLFSIAAEVPHVSARYSQDIRINNYRNTIYTICNRIYNLRCAIVHSKKSPGEFFEPEPSNLLIERHVPLLEFLANKVINSHHTGQQWT